VIVPPVPVGLPLPLRCAIPLDVCAVPLLPIRMPGPIFMVIKVVIIPVVLIVQMVTIIMVSVSIMITVVMILRQQSCRDEQRSTQREYHPLTEFQQSSFHC
jgi:hypothetical protein